MRRLADTPIWLRLTAAIWLMLVIAWGSMIAWETRVTRDMAIDQAKDFAATVNEMTLAGLTGMMITGTVAQRDVFLDQIKELSVVRDLKVIRGEEVSKVFGPGPDGEFKADPVERQALVDGKALMRVHIPQASRKQRPVFLNGQPLGNTYRRLHEGDRHCDDDTVRRMLAEQLDDSRDARILHRFGLQDVDLESLHAYRGLFAAYKPGHPWVAPDDLSFLRLIGAWRLARGS